MTRAQNVIRYMDWLESVLELGKLTITVGGDGMPLGMPFPLPLSELKELGVEVEIIVVGPIKTTSDEVEGDPLDIEIDSVEEIQFPEDDKRSLYAKQRDLTNELRLPEFADVDAWARAFARDASRIIDRQGRPKPRGTYESGPQLNVQNLYRMQTEIQPRIYKRRSTPTPEPREFYYVRDESGSIANLPDELKKIYERLSYALAEGLARAMQDFALMGYGNNHFWYKKFREPYGDAVRRRLIPERGAGKRYKIGRSDGGGTGTSSAIKVCREDHKLTGGGPKKKRTILLFTDGNPTDFVADEEFTMKEGFSGGPGSLGHSQKSVRHQVELAHGDGLTTVGILLAKASIGANREKFITQMQGMFDRQVILSHDRYEAEAQLRHLLLAELKRR